MGRYFRVAVGSASVPRPPYFLGVVDVGSRPSPWGPFVGCGGGGCGCGSWFCCVVVHWWSLSPVWAVVPFFPAPPPLCFFLRSLLCTRPRGRWPAFSPAGVCAGVSRISFPPAHRWLRGCGGLLCLAGRRWAGWVASRCPIGVSRGRCPWCCLAGGVDCLAGAGAWLCGCVTVPLAFLRSPWVAGVRSWGRVGPLGCLLFVGEWGFPPSLSLVFFGRGAACCSLYPPWASACTSRLVAWLTGLLFVLRVAAGRSPAPCALWPMYTHGLVARFVGSGSGSAGWRVAPAGFVGSWVRGEGACLGRLLRMGLPSVPPPLWCRFGAGGFNFSVVICAGGLPRAGGGGCVPLFLALPSGGFCTAGRVVAFSLCVVGRCGGVSRLWACFFSFLGCEAA